MKSPRYYLACLFLIVWLPVAIVWQLVAWLIDKHIARCNADGRPYWLWHKHSFLGHTWDAYHHEIRRHDQN